MTERRAFRKSLRSSYGFWPWLDDIGHKLKLRRWCWPLSRLLCYKADKAFGVCDDE